MCSSVWLTRLVSVVGLVLSALLLAPVLITLAGGGDSTTIIPFLSYLQVGPRIPCTISHYYQSMGD